MKTKTKYLSLLILMSVLGLMSTDIYLPSLPEVKMTFNSSNSITQFTISIFLLGLAISQLIYGPLSEKYGRKIVLMIGMIIYLISTIICIFSPTIEFLIFARLFQGIGSAAGMTIGRTLVNDLFSKEESGKIFTTIFPFVGISPAIAPYIGSNIDIYFGWNASFVFLLFLGIILFIGIITILPKNINTLKNDSLHPTKIMGEYKRLLSNRTFLSYVMMPCIAYVIYFAYITESVFILHEHQFSVKTIGLSFISVSISYVIGNLTSRRLLDYFEFQKVLTIGYVFFFISGIVMLFSSYREFHLILFLLPITILTFANGFLIPLGTAGVIKNFSNSSGYASGLLGFLQLSSATLSSFVIEFITHGKYDIFYIYLAVIVFIEAFIYYRLFLMPISLGNFRIFNRLKK